MYINIHIFIEYSQVRKGPSSRKKLYRVIARSYFKLLESAVKLVIYHKNYGHFTLIYICLELNSTFIFINSSNSTYLFIICMRECLTLFII